MRRGGLLLDDKRALSVLDIKEQHERDSHGLLDGLRMRLTLDGGRTANLQARAISPPCYFSGGGYDDGRHGLDRGDLLIEGETWDVTPVVTDDAVPYYSRVTELELDGRPGVGHVEPFIGLIGRALVELGVGGVHFVRITRACREGLRLFGHQGVHANSIDYSGSPLRRSSS